jgi:uncharacterized protein YaaR (DUF327 family)
MAFAVFLTGCFFEDQSKEAESIKIQIGEQSSRIQSLEDNLGEIKARSAEDNKTLSSLTEYVDAVKNSLQSLSDSQDAQKEEKQTELKALTSKIDEIADRMQRLTEQVNTRKVAPASTPAKPVVFVEKEKKKTVPPFFVLGIEYRGQEPFLAVIDKVGKNLSDVKLFQPADQVAEFWWLKSFDANRAVFVVEGQEILIALP